MGLARLLLLSGLMLVATVLAAFFPLFVRFSPRKLALISTFSQGLLIGAALSVVIPEGVEAVYANAGQSHSHEGAEHAEHSSSAGYIGVALLTGFILMYLIDSFHPHSPPPTPPHRHAHIRRASLYLNRDPTSRERVERELEPLSYNPPRPFDHSHTKSDSVNDTDDEGSIRMHDHLLPSNIEDSPGAGVRKRPHSPTTASFKRLAKSSSIGNLIEATSGGRNAKMLSTVLGLLAHSVADGISLGASSSSSGTGVGETDSNSLDLLIFVAIMLHKGPTAFALSTLLLSSASPAPSLSSSDPLDSTLDRPTGTSRRFITTSLFLFSLAAPLSAILTYFIISSLSMFSAEIGDPSAGDVEKLRGFYTGLVLVFSGGSFLFVANGVLNGAHTPPPTHSHSSTLSHRKSTKDSLVRQYKDDELPPSPSIHDRSYGFHAQAGSRSGSGSEGEESVSGEEAELGGVLRTTLVLCGMITPGLLGRLVGHGH